VVSVTVMLMQHHIAVFATAFVMVLVTVIWMWHHIVYTTALIPLNLILCIKWCAVKWRQSYGCTFCPYRWSFTASLTLLFEKQSVVLHVAVTIMLPCKEMWLRLQVVLA
jgi:hypothetical protein